MTLAAENFQSIDWDAWMPAEQATLLFVVNEDKVLLIEKKRGIGAGKINGPGGRIDPGEDPLEAAVREVEEELRVTPIGIVKVGEVLFQVLNGVSIRIHVFRADDCRACGHQVSLVHELMADALWIDMPRPANDKRNSVSPFPNV